MIPRLSDSTREKVPEMQDISNLLAREMCTSLRFSETRMKYPSSRTIIYSERFHGSSML